MAVPSAANALQTTMAPGPRGVPVLGVTPEVQRDALSFLTHTAALHGAVSQFRLGMAMTFLLNTPVAAPAIWGGEVAPAPRAVRALFGDGPLLSPRVSWASRRKLRPPTTFPAYRSALVMQAAMMTLEELKHLLREGSMLGLDLAAPLITLIQRVTLRTVLGLDFRASRPTDPPGIGEIVRTDVGPLSAPLSGSALAALGARAARPGGAHTRLQATAQSLQAARRLTGVPGDDLLGLLLACRDGADAGLSERELFEDVCALYDLLLTTTSQAVTWAIVALVNHPELFARVRAEVDTALSGRIPRDDTLGRLTLTRQVLLETMRLFPPVWVTACQVAAPLNLLGYAVPKGAVVLLSPYVVHRTAAYWTDPDQFRPERHGPTTSVGGAGAYIPFGVGGQDSLGYQAALAQATTVLALLIQRLDLQCATPPPLTPQAGAGLRLSAGLPLLIRDRMAPAPASRPLSAPAARPVDTRSRDH